MTNAEILSDLDYVKSMAEEGRNAPMLGGRMGLWWGTLLCLTLLTHWLILTQRIPAPESAIGFAWMCFGVFGTLGSILLGRSLRSKPGGASANNRVAAAMWTGSAVFLLTFGFAAGTSAALGYIDYDIMNIMMPVAFGIYGLASYVTSKISGEKWLLLPAILGLLMMAGALFMMSSPDLYLLSVIGVIGTIIIPSLIHLRREPSNVV